MTDQERAERGAPIPPAGHSFVRRWTRTFHIAPRHEGGGLSNLPAICGETPTDTWWISFGHGYVEGFRLCKDCARKAKALEVSS